MINPEVLYINFASDGECQDSRSYLPGIAHSKYSEEVLESFMPIKKLRVSDNKKFKKIKNNLYIPRNWFGNLKESLCFTHKLLTKSKGIKIVIFYHSFIWVFLIPLLRLFNIKVILQVNEIFYNAGTHNSFFYKLVELTLFRLSHGFILSSKATLPFIKKSGSTQPVVGEIPGPLIKPFNKSKSTNGNKIKLVYAGVIDYKDKRGAFITAELAQKLNNIEYEIDIFGFGSEKNISKLISEIKINNKTSKTKIFYNGSVSPKKLASKLDNYDIGLAIQGKDASFSESSFPSKILTYISAGLSVVATGTTAVNCWNHKNLIFVYKNNDLSDLLDYLLRYNKNSFSKDNNAEKLDNLIKNNLKEGFDDFICRIS